MKAHIFSMAVKSVVLVCLSQIHMSIFIVPLNRRDGYGAIADHLPYIEAG